MIEKNFEWATGQMVKYAERHKEIVLSIGFSEKHSMWTTMAMFGKESDDSPMAGGALHGVGDTAMKAFVNLFGGDE